MQNACELHDSKPCQFGIRSKDELKDLEGSLSLLVATALNQFIFEQERQGRYYHQWPVKMCSNKPGSAETADGAVVTMEESLPGMPVLASDVKRFSIKEATVETADMMEEKHNPKDDSWPTILGLPMTRSIIRLYIFVLGNQKLIGINVLQGKPWDRAILLTLLVAVRYLCKNPIITLNVMTKPKPLKDTQLVCLKDRVFHDKIACKMWKFFPKSSAAKVNVEVYWLLFEKYAVMNYDELTVIITCYLGPGPNLHRTDHNFLTFSGALNMLGTMHMNNYIHRDVRAENIIIFGDTSYLIDYDLSRKVGSKYPYGYHGEADGLFERHCDAIAGNEKNTIDIV